jgi:DNA primase
VLPEGKEASFEAKMGALDRLKPITTLLPVGLMRSAFFASLAGYTGLPAQELEAALKGKASPLRPAPKPGQGEPVPAWRARSEAPPEPYEALFAACLLKDRKLIRLDQHRVADELKHSELRSMVAGLASGQSPEDVLYDASPATKKGLETANGQLNPDTLEPSFEKVCKTLKVHSINEQLARISAELARLPSKSELSDDAKELLAEQRQLMALRRELTGR